MPAREDAGNKPAVDGVSVNMAKHKKRALMVVLAVFLMLCAIAFMWHTLGVGRANFISAPPTSPAVGARVVRVEIGHTGGCAEALATAPS